MALGRGNSVRQLWQIVGGIGAVRTLHGEQ